MCRLSIVVPYRRDEASFEATLVSVLENRPEHCEVLVAHDGSYDDPFDLGDEVRFVAADRADLVTLVRTAAAAARGRFLHVLAGGARATESWTDPALECFERDDVAVVAPVAWDLRDRARIIAAGWRDGRSGLRCALGRGAKWLSRHEAVRVEGAYLSASFWRLSALDEVLDAPLGLRPAVADYGWSMLLQRAGWRCSVAEPSRVVASPQLVTPGVRLGSAQQMQAIRTAVRGERRGRAVAGALWTLALRPHQPSAWSEALGRLVAFGAAAADRSLQEFAASVAGPTEMLRYRQRTLSLALDAAPLRRAA